MLKIKDFPTPPLVAIMGPTASGKSALAIKIAEKIPSEIVSVDSMQCYRTMDIGTAKPSMEEMQKTPHHLINIFDIEKRVTVYSYVELIEKAVLDITSRNKIAILVGGTGLYMKAFLYGLDLLPTDEKLKNSLYLKYENNLEGIKKELSILDPAAAETFSQKPRKMIRALEVYKLTGKSILKQNQSWLNTLRYPVLAYRLKWERKTLYDRISNRIEEMLSNGWIEETKKLEGKGFFSSPTAKQAIGYLLIHKYLNKIISYDEMKMRIIASTKKYARRQETWFNNQHPESSQLLLPQDEKLICEKILLQIKKASLSCSTHLGLK